RAWRTSCVREDNMTGFHRGEFAGQKEGGTEVPPGASEAMSKGQPRTHLNEAGSGSGRDLAVQTRRQVRGWCAETHHVECIGGLAAQLQRESFSKVDVAQDPHVNIAIPRPNKIIARRVAICAALTNAKAGAVVGKRRSVEPLGGRFCAASVWTEERILSGYQIRPVIVCAVKVFVGAGDNVDRRAAVESGDGR